MKDIARVILLLSFVFVAVFSIAAETGDYRLAGTMNTASGDWLAVLELPGGEQRLLGAGDPIPGGEVLEIGATWLRLFGKTGELTLALEGDDSHINDHRPDHMFVTVEASLSLRDALQETRTSDGDADQLERDIRRLLRIPGSGKIAAINDRAVESATQGLELLLRSLGSKTPVRIEVSGIDGFDAVYLTPLQAEDHTTEE